jgi:predicted kinase
MEAVIFVGIQGAGKTSFYRARFFDTHVRISLDMLRTRYREQQFLNTCIATRQRFVVDNTNPTRADRMRYIAPARACGFKLCAYFFKTELANAICRNNLRTPQQRVPPVALTATRRKLQLPDSEEGFDSIFTVELTSHGEFIVEPQL